MRSLRNLWLAGPVLGLLLGVVGCHNTPVDITEQGRGPIPLRAPSPEKQAEGCGSYEDSLTGGQVFKMYCGTCHHAPSLAERPFSNFQNVAAHMRVRANLTGKEYAKVVEFLRRFHDVPPPNPPLEPSPKRFIFSQPMQELRERDRDRGTENKQADDRKVLPAPRALEDAPAAKE
jgi:hypothetical protein